MRLPVLALPEDYRVDLACPQGTLFVNPSSGVVSGLEADVAVGDIVSMRHRTRVRVIDFKTKRSEYIAPTAHKCKYVVNPRGCVSLMAATLSKLLNRDICVVGEEDMLVVAYMLSQTGTILYGQPGVGVVRVKASIHEALKVLRILKPAVVEA